MGTTQKKTTSKPKEVESKAVIKDTFEVTITLNHGPSINKCESIQDVAQVIENADRRWGNLKPVYKVMHSSSDGDEDITKEVLKSVLNIPYEEEAKEEKTED